MEQPIIEKRVPPRKNSRGVFAFQIAGLMVAAWFFREALNPDGVAYLQIASRYARGQTGPAVSGYWGPLLSWMMAPLLRAGIPPLATARTVMALSAIIFLLGCRRIFCRGKLDGPFFNCGLWTMATVSILWSVEVITPDLLLAGIILFAFAEMLDARWYLRPGTAFGSGALWGLAYLGKAVGLPLGILISLGVAVLWWRKNPGARREIVRSLGLTLAGLALVAGPWVAALSWHYAKFTVSTSASHAHALVGPSVVWPVHLLDEGFRRPEQGQITIWEDPPLPDPDWSPWESWRNAAHQIKIMGSNTPVVLYMLTSISLAFPLLLAAGLVRRGKFQTDPDNDTRPAWFLWPVAALALIYLPDYVMMADQRFFYVAAPLLFVGAAGLLCPGPLFRQGWRRRVAVLLLAGSLLVPALARSALYSNQTRLAGQYAHVLAQKIGQAGLSGPVAGSGRLPGGRAGLYTAWLLGQPWFGDELSPDAADFKGSGASLIIVNRGSRIAQELAQDASFRNLDGDLFSPDEAGQFPLQVFGRR